MNCLGNKQAHPVDPCNTHSVQNSSQVFACHHFRKEQCSVSEFSVVDIFI